MLLALETATSVCAVALLDGQGACVAERTTDEPRAHAARLAPMIAEVLAEGGIAPVDLATVAVSAGPGSFTGLRIGMGTAAGLALSTGAGLVRVPTLDALLNAARAADRFAEEVPCVAVLPSRRGEVFAGDDDAPRVLSLEELPRWAGGRLVVAPLDTDLPADLSVVRVAPSAQAVGRWALAHGVPEPAEAAVPFYVQAFVPVPRTSVSTG